MDDFLASPDAEAWIAKWELERDRCLVHGGSFTECPDDDRDWFPQRTICWPAAQQAAAQRRYDLRHKEQPYHDGSFQRWAKEPSREFPFHYLDGVTIWLAETDENPNDDFLGDVVAAEELIGERREADDQQEGADDGNWLSDS